MSVRGNIVTEVKRRLHLYFDARNVAKIASGHPGLDIFKQVPAIFIFEDEENREFKGNGKYKVRFPLYIEYIKVYSNKEDGYDEGHVMIEDLQAAMELDQRLANASGVDLATSFYMASNVILLHEEPKVAVHVGVEYIFEYVEDSPGSRLMGYNRRPH